MTGTESNEGMHHAARGVLEPLLDTPLPMQVQHYGLPRTRRIACGAYGQVAFTPGAVTCDACKAYLAKRRGR